MVKDNTPPSTNHFDFVEAQDKAHRLQGESSYTKSILDDFLRVMNTMGEDAQDDYDRTLAELRKNPEDIIIEIARQEKATIISDYPKRWALIYAAADLRHPSSLPLLRNIVLTPIPPEESKDPHSFSTVGEETILRTTAVDGVRYLAEQGNDIALKSLYEFLTIPSISIRRASVQAILAIRKDKVARQELEQLLPKEQHFLLDVKVVHVTDVSQIENPERYLKESAKEMNSPKQPNLPSSFSGKKGSGERPKVQG